MKPQKQVGDVLRTAGVFEAEGLNLTDSAVAPALLAELLADPTRIADLDPIYFPALLVHLSAIQTAVAVRLAMMSGKNASEESDSPLDVDEAAAYARCSVWTLREAAKIGRIADASKPGRSWRFTKRGLDKWIASRRGR